MAALKVQLLRLFRRLVRAGIRRGYNLMEEPRTKLLYDLVYDLLRPRGLAQVELDGRPFWVDADARGLAPKLLLLGTYEPHLTKIFSGLVEPGMTIIDVGANVGYYTALAAARVGPTGRVIAFEPDPENFSVLSLNAKSLCDRAAVEVYSSALSDHESTATLFRDYRSSSRSSLSQVVVRRPGGQVEVPTRCLDASVRPDQRIDLIKIDTEGSEGAVVRGGRKTIERCRPMIVMEFWPYALRANGVDPQALLDFLAGLGYAFFVVSQRAELECAAPSHLVSMAVSRLPAGDGHLELLLCPPGFAGDLRPHG